MNQDILIIPIFIDDAKLPENDNVPGALKKFLYCSFHHLQTVFWSKNMEYLLEYLEKELSFIKDVKRKLTESVEVYNQRLSEVYGKNLKKDGDRRREAKNMRCPYLHLLIPDWSKLVMQSSIFKSC